MLLFDGGNSVSQQFQVLAGVRQGGLLSTILFSIFSASLSIRIASRALMLLNIRPSHLSIRTCEQWQHGCIRMPFGVVSGVGLGMSVLDFGGNRRRGRGSLG